MTRTCWQGDLEALPHQEGRTLDSVCSGTRLRRACVGMSGTFDRRNTSCDTMLFEVAQQLKKVAGSSRSSGVFRPIWSSSLSVACSPCAVQVLGESFVIGLTENGKV